MGSQKPGKPKPGFQGSETSWAEVIIYSHGNDPIVIGSSGAQAMAGRYRTDTDNTLLSVSTNKALESAGSFQVLVKPSRSVTDNVLERVVDDDWVDIVFHRHGRTWHTMRGLVTDLRRTRSVAGSGATSWVYSIVGQDFQRIFEITPLWFNRFSYKVELAEALAMQIFNNAKNVGGDPEETVKKMLLGWFRTFRDLGRATWKMPDTVPNTQGTFYYDILAGWNSQGFSGIPKRVSCDPNLMNPSGNLWPLVKGWADPAFMELFCDLSKGGKQLEADEELTVEDSALSVFFRDRPFVLSQDIKDDQGLQAPAKLLRGKDSPWFSLPLHIIPRQQLVNDDVGRSGSERINAFYLSQQTTAEMTRSAPPDMIAPLWDEQDIEIHGLRRYDIASRYSAKGAQLLNLSVLQRSIARDWYAINPYLYNGTLALGLGRPEIHVGTRVRIPGDNGDTTLDETYYVENVGHSWQFGPGLRTNLGVTRGWIGNDNALLRAVTDLAGRYKTAMTVAPIPSLPEDMG